VIIKPWTFAQLGGPKKITTLTGWDAPFGRPRQGPIVNAGISIRRSVTYYTDTAGATPPTVHAIGTEPKSWELHGRWMDSSGSGPGGIGKIANTGTGRARELQRYWSDFVSDKQLVRAKWGDILSYVIFIHDLDLHYESETHLTWKLTADVIKDDQAPVPKHSKPSQTPIDFADSLRSELAASVFNGKTFTSIGALLGELSDTIGLLVGGLQAPFAAVYDTALALSDFETALSSDLGKMASGLQTIKTSVLALQDATELALSRVALLDLETSNFDWGPVGLLSGEDQVDLAASKIDSDLAIDNVLALIADMQAEIARAQRGTTTTAQSAQDGDTWESLSTRAFGGPSGARAIKDANGVRYGQRPQPGKLYKIPRQG
jgi:hypothetical protein